MLSLLIGGLLLAPAASAAPAAVDQYTETAPTGPSGSSGSNSHLQTHGTPQQQTANHRTPPTAVPAPEPADTSAPAPETTAPAAPAAESDTASASPSDHAAAKPHREARRRRLHAALAGQQATQHPATQHPSRVTSSPVGDRSGGTTTDDGPLTPFVLVLLLVGLAALAVRVAVGVYGRIRDPARGTG